MMKAGTNSGTGRPSGASGLSIEISPEHYWRVLLHRKWIAVGVFLVVSAGTFIYSYRLPDIYTSSTVIMVDPQKVPENYVKPTITGDVRNRLGTLSQQILSATRLQKIIDTLKLYSEEKKALAREDVINKMRADISLNAKHDFGGGQDLQAFQITYRGRDPRVVAQVANELASVFIDENLKAREQQAAGTTEFLQNQLQEARKILETQESKLRDFRLKHIGEMPEQQTADLQILGQLQSQLQLESDALARAEQQKSITQALLSQSTVGAVDLDENDDTQPAGTKASKSPPKSTAPSKPSLSAATVELNALLARGYTEQHPLIRKLRVRIAEEDAAKPPEVAAVAPVAKTPEPTPVAAVRSIPQPTITNNPVLQTQLRMAEEEIAKHKQEQQRLSNRIASYHGKLEAIPLREQEIASLVRDSEISKAHYSQLLDKQLSAETATQLEIRQKGEKFSILDPAQLPERPTSPNRQLLNLGGMAVGLGLGLLIALITEFFGTSITGSEQISDSTGVPVLEVIPLIQTQVDRRRRHVLLIASSMVVVLAVLVSCAILAYHFRS